MENAEFAEVVLDAEHAGFVSELTATDNTPRIDL
jgi:hypothetical protein